MAQRKEFKSRDHLEHPISWGSRTLVLHGAQFRCTCCGNWKRASEFGMLNDAEGGMIRNQPQCRVCRSRYGTG